MFLVMVFQAIATAPQVSAERRWGQKQREPVGRRERGKHRAPYYDSYRHFRRPIYPFYRQTPIYRVWPREVWIGRPYYEVPTVYLPPAYSQALEPGSVLESLPSGTYVTTWGLMTVQPAIQNQLGHPCREFQAEAISGVACRGPDAIWRITSSR